MIFIQKKKIIISGSFSLEITIKDDYKLKLSLMPLLELGHILQYQELANISIFSCQPLQMSGAQPQDKRLLGFFRTRPPD